MSFFYETTSKNIIGSGWVRYNNGQLALQMAGTVSRTGEVYSAQRFYHKMPNGDVLYLEWTPSSQLYGALYRAGLQNITLVKPRQLIGNYTAAGMQSVCTVGSRSVGVVLAVSNGFSLLTLEVNDTAISVSQGLLTLNGDWAGGQSFYKVAKLAGQQLALLNDARLGLVALSFDQAGLAATVLALLVKAGFNATQCDVSALADTRLDGFVIDDVMSARGSLAMLSTAYQFALVESDGFIKAILLNGGAVTVLDPQRVAMLSDKEVGSSSPYPRYNRAQFEDIPYKLVIDCLDRDRLYEVASYSAQRDSTGHNMVAKQSLPLVLAPDEAYRVAAQQLALLWHKRETTVLRMPFSYAALDVGDLVSYGGQVYRVDVMDWHMPFIDVTVSRYHGLPDTTAQGVDARSISSPDTQAIKNGAAEIILFDAPLLRLQDNSPGVGVAVLASDWKGGSVFISQDGVNDSQTLPLNRSATGGYTVGVLGDALAQITDQVNTVDVVLRVGTLASCTASDLNKGLNAALIGREIVQFQNAVLIGPQTYRLSALRRGRLGTEHETALHTAGEIFLLLDEDSMAFISQASYQRGLPLYYKAVDARALVDQVFPVVFSSQHTALRPYSPAHVTVEQQPNGDWLIRWVRRTRYPAPWVDYVDTTQNDESLLFDLEITDGITTRRSVTGLSALEYTYTATDQLTDFGAVQAALTFALYQVNPLYGRGIVFNYPPII